MRPTPTRCFYATILRAKQPLFEEWVRPLNKKQQKVLNKAAIYYGPQYHGGLKRDVRNVISVYERRPAEQERNAELRKRLEELIRKHAGERYQLGDISPVTYGLDLHDIPSEFIVVDTQYPYGIPPTEEIPSSIAYNKERLADILHEEGFMLASPPLRIHRQMTNPTGYINAPALHISDPQPFTLSLPNPAIIRTAKLLGTYLSLSEAIHDTFRAAYIWARSHGLDNDLKPMTLALAVVAYCQLEKRLPSLSKPRTTPPPSWKEHPQIWVPFRAEVQRDRGERRDSLMAERRLAVDTSFAETPTSAVRERAISGMLAGFFGFWADSPSWFTDHIVSIRSGRLVPRQLAYVGSTASDSRQPLPRALREPDTYGLVSSEIGDDFSVDPDAQPRIWAYQPLVLPDPFLTTYNHAAGIHPKGWTRFWKACLNSRQTIVNSNPFTKVLGDYYSSAREALRRERQPAPGQPGSAASSAPHESSRGSPSAAADLPSPPPFNGIGKNRPKRELLPHLGQPISRQRGSRTYHTSRHDQSADHTVAILETIVSAPCANVLDAASDVVLDEPSIGVLDAAYNLTRDYPMLVDSVSPKTLMHRRQALQDVKSAVQQKYGKRYTVEAFGSTQYGVSSSSSDVDMVIIDTENPMGFRPELNLRNLPATTLANSVGYFGYQSLEAS